MLVLNELFVKVTLTDEDQSGGNTANQSNDSEVSGIDAIVKTCVEKVMEIINESKER